MTIDRYGQMEKDIQRSIKENQKVDYYSWPGACPLYYITKDEGVLCPKCVNENISLVTDPDDPQWYIVSDDINYEDEFLCCDHCGEKIESAYGDDDNQEG